MCNEQARRVALGLLRDDINDLRIPVHFPEGLPNLEPTDSIRITDRNVILRASPVGGAELVVRRWSWPGTHGKPVYNLRSDGRRFDRGRCLIVADAFFEFSDPAPDAAGRRPRRKRRWRFEKRGEPWFAIAGIWRAHPEVGEAYTMLTIPPGADVAPYHDRQVAVIERRDFEEWLDPDARPEHLLQPPAPGSFDVSEVVAPVGQ
ncbi:SOS response-associated peptidase family protein [Sphingomonas sp.]|jgi:putative SOS response-associated peptidase YedK|uniref:SOS response-associated peptidase family protein n=1 Tax=Sphingomonas sp. TaxID=28214 RepID=UPI002E12214D|nr:SOS response-associated peptidase family protein [Sphingomonas sp.]HEV7287785.1 SOS response-associated peptidase family protein [Sphingomonas sp.]